MAGAAEKGGAFAAAARQADRVGGPAAFGGDQRLATAGAQEGGVREIVPRDAWGEGALDLEPSGHIEAREQVDVLFGGGGFSSSRGGPGATEGEDNLHIARLGAEGVLEQGLVVCGMHAGGAGDGAAGAAGHKARVGVHGPDGLKAEEALEGVVADHTGQEGGLELEAVGELQRAPEELPLLLLCASVLLLLLLG